MINVGDRLPEVLGTDEQGREIRLSEMAGRSFILYFYPKDNTSGCTAEACSLRDRYAELSEAGYEVIGVSVDSEKSHRNFIEKHQLPFRLIADTEKSLVQALGVWDEKKMYGRTYMGILCTTLIVNGEGKVEHIFVPKDIKTKIHAEQILSYLES